MKNILITIKYLLFEKQTLNGLLKVIGIQKGFSLKSTYSHFLNNDLKNSSRRILIKFETLIHTRTRTTRNTQTRIITRIQRSTTTTRIQGVRITDPTEYLNTRIKDIQRSRDQTTRIIIITIGKQDQIGLQQDLNVSPATTSIHSALMVSSPRMVILVR